MAHKQHNRGPISESPPSRKKSNFLKKKKSPKQPDAAGEPLALMQHNIHQKMQSDEPSYDDYDDEYQGMLTIMTVCQIIFDDQFSLKDF